MYLIHVSDGGKHPRIWVNGYLTSDNKGESEDSLFGPQATQTHISWMKGKYGFLEKGPYNFVTSMTYAMYFPQSISPKWLYQGDYILGTLKYPGFSEIKVYPLKTNANTNLYISDVPVRVRT